MNNTTATLEALNTYTGDNVWQDIILRLDDYDTDDTAAVDDGQARDFIAGGVHYHHDGGEWIAR